MSEVIGSEVKAAQTGPNPPRRTGMNMLCEQAISAIFKILAPYLRRPVDVASRLVRADLDRHSARALAARRNGRHAGL